MIKNLKWNCVSIFTLVVTCSMVSGGYLFSADVKSNSNEMKAKVIFLFADKIDSDGNPLPDKARAEKAIEDITIHEGLWTSKESIQKLIVIKLDGTDRVGGLMNIWLAVADFELGNLLTPILVLRGDYVEARPLPGTFLHPSKVLLRENWMHQGALTQSVKVLEFKQDGTHKITTVMKIRESHNLRLGVSIAVTKHEAQQDDISEVYIWNQETQTFQKEK